MVRVPSLPAVSAIGQFLRDSGYDIAHLGDQLDLSDSLYANHENLAPLLARTAGDSTLSVLARLFFVCWPIPESRCRAALPHWFIQSALECGLLIAEAEGLASSACVLPFRSRLIVSDSARTRTTRPDMVTGPSASTHFAARLAIPGHQETTLDLGTGSGALALEAVHYSRSVVATDINPRTLQFAAFNAALNDVTQVEWRCGDAFSPVAGQTFTRIIANPPFFLTPGHTFTYCDSPLDLDGFTARLARECSTYLEEGGYYQMICEWVEIAGESWEQRLRDWTSQSGCDVLVLIAPRLTPIAYAEKRDKESRLMQAGAPEHPFNARYQYLIDRNVTHVIGGVITMQKRTAPSNWFTIVATEPVGHSVGDSVQARMQALTYLATHSENELLAASPQLASDVVLTKVSAAAANSWQTQTLELVKTTGLVDKLRLDETVTRFIPLFDGTHTCAQIAALVADQLHITPEDATQRTLQLARRLLQSTFANLTSTP